MVQGIGTGLRTWHLCLLKRVFHISGIVTLHRSEIEESILHISAASIMKLQSYTHRSVTGGPEGFGLVHRHGVAYLV